VLLLRLLHACMRALPPTGPDWCVQREAPLPSWPSWPAAL